MTRDHTAIFRKSRKNARSNHLELLAAPLLLPASTCFQVSESRCCCLWKLESCRMEQVGPKHDIIFMITKMGYLFLFDIHSGKALYRAKISEQTIFVTTTHVSVATERSERVVHRVCGLKFGNLQQDERGILRVGSLPQSIGILWWTISHVSGESSSPCSGYTSQSCVPGMVYRGGVTDRTWPKTHGTPAEPQWMSRK